MKNLALVAGFVSLTGCMTSPNPRPGFIFTSVDGPNQAKKDKGVNVTKRGVSCSGSILGLVAWGDASIDSARKKGGISVITSVDYSNKSVLFIVYNETCAIVNGG